MEGEDAGGVAKIEVELGGGVSAEFVAGSEVEPGLGWLPIGAGTAVFGFALCGVDGGADGGVGVGGVRFGLAAEKEEGQEAEDGNWCSHI